MTASVPSPKVSKFQIKLDLSNALNLILTPWPALLMAIENSFGGPDTREKADWLREVIAEFVLSKKAIDRDDLESFILSIMETEFNTYVEDGSCSKLCAAIVRVYSAVQLNDILEVEQILSPFRMLNGHTARPVCPSVAPLSAINEELDICHKPLQEPTEMRTMASVEPSEYRLEPHECMEQGDEWQVVTRAKRKKKSFPH